MAAKKFLTLIAGARQLISAIVVSAGAGNAGDLVALDDNGKLDESVMPSGIGAESVTVPASENLAAGDQIDLWNDGGTIKARKADATAVGKPADGFVKAAVTSGQNAVVYMPGQQITGLTGLTLDADYFLSTTPGLITSTAPSTVGNVVQRVGKALSATVLFFYPDTPTEIIS